MKKNILVLIIALAFIGSAFAAPVYDVSANVLMDTYGPGDTLNVYGFINHETGGGAYSSSSLTLRFYNALSGPSLSTSITSIEYLSEYNNPDNLLLDGVFMGKRTLSGLSTGQYFVEVLINNEVKSSVQFNYDEELSRNSTLTVPSSYITAGNINVGYTISKKNTVDDVTYTTGFYTPTFQGMGNAKKVDELFVGMANSSSKLASFTSAEFSRVANILVVKVLSTDQTVQDIPQAFARLWQVGQLSSIESAGEILFNFEDCTAKEDVTRECAFTVKNTGDYPSKYTVKATSEIENSVSFTTGLIQPGTQASGVITLKAEEGDFPSKNLKLELMYAGAVLQTITGSVKVDPRDLVNQVSILDFKVMPLDARPGDEVTVSFKLSNTGDYTERVKVQYSINEKDPVTTGSTYSLLPGQTRSISLSFTAPDEEMIVLTLNVLKNDELMSGRITNVYIEQFVFTPSVLWKTQYVYLQQGETSENKLRIRNDGNTPEFFEMSIADSFASLKERVYLMPGQSMDLAIPILVSDKTNVGVYKIGAEMCSVTSGECDDNEFTLTVLEMSRDNSTIVLNQTLQELKGDQGAVFEILVKNFEGSTKSYSVSIGQFEGDVQVSPSTQIIMNGEEGVFYLYAKPENRITQDLPYNVLAGDEIVSSGNLTLSYGSMGLTGLITLSEAGSIGAVIIGVTLIAALVFLGVKSFNQSKVELKYWK